MASERTFCQICNAQCGMITYLEGGEVVRVEGDPEDPGCRGQLCIKGEHNANRLTDDQLCDPVAGTPAYKDLRCQVTVAKRG